MRKIPLNFCFKGDRDYVQGAEMYKEIIKILSQEFIISQIFNFHILIHKLTRANCYLLLGENNQSFKPPKEYIANFTFNSRDITFKGYIVEENRSIECRSPYNEDELYKLLSFNGKKMELLQDSPFSFIETIVAMNKHLHNTIYSSSGKWLFTRLDLIQIPYEEISNSLCIELTRNFNNLFTKSKITFNNNVIGSIYFSLVV